MNREQNSFDLQRYLTSRAPSFIVVRGVVYVTIGGTTTVVPPQGVGYSKHGMFQVAYAEDSWAVIKHLTVNCHEIILFIPPRHRFCVSNGKFTSYTVNYQSFVDTHDAGILVTRRNRIEYGRQFYWNHRGHNWSITSSGAIIMVFPPKRDRDYWMVKILHTNEEIPIRDSNPEERAFAVAVGYAQKFKIVLPTVQTV